MHISLKWMKIEIVLLIHVFEHCIWIVYGSMYPFPVVIFYVCKGQLSGVLPISLILWESLVMLPLKLMGSEKVPNIGGTVF